MVFLTEAHKDIIRRKDGFDGNLHAGSPIVHVGLPELPALTQWAIASMPR